MSRRFYSKRKKVPKRHRPVRVVDPVTNFHTARVSPRQSINLVLRQPYTFLPKCSQGAQFKVRLNSDYLLSSHAEFEPKSEQMIYHFVQKYDLSDWSELGEVFLGNITLDIVDNQHPQAEKWQVNICIILSAKTDEKKGTLTVINPSNHDVKIEMDQVLEVVCFQNEWNDWSEGKIEASGHHDSWSHKPSDESFPIRGVKHEVAADRSHVLTQEEGDYILKNRFHFKANPYLPSEMLESVEKEIASYVKPIREYHWWYRIEDDSVRKLVPMADDVYHQGTHEFEGQCKNGEVEFYDCKKLDLYLVKRTKKAQQMHPYFIDAVKDKDKVCERSYDKTTKMLCNPDKNETIDFTNKKSYLILELIQPSVIWNDLDAEDKWEFSIDKENDTSKVILHIMPIMHRWNTWYQRVKVEIGSNLSGINEVHSFLGALTIQCPKKSHLAEARKRVSFWLLDPEHKIVPEKKSICTINSSSYIGTSTTGGSKVYKCTDTKNYNGNPKISEVALAEVSSDTLEEGATYKRMSDLIPKKKERESNDSSSTSQGNQETALSALDQICKNGSKSSEEKKKENTERQYASFNINNECGPPDIVVCDAEHLQQVHLRLNQKAVLRFSNTSVRIEDTQNLSILRHTTMPAGGKQVKEVALKVTKYPTLAQGSWPAGKAVFLDQDKKPLIVFFLVDIDESSNSKMTVKKIPNFNFIGSQAGDGKEKISIIRWKHLDAVVLKPAQKLYIRHSRSNDWTDNGVLEIQQRPIPEDAWEEALCANSHIDYHNPWFCKRQTSIRGVHLFQSVADQQPHLQEILKEIARRNPELDIFYIGQLIFKNLKNRKAVSVETPYGVLSCNYQMEKSLGVFIELPKNKEVLVLNSPDDKTEVHLSEDVKKVVVKFPTQYMEVPKHRDITSVEVHWLIRNIPSILTHVETEREGQWSVFHFERNIMSCSCGGNLIFSCGNRSLTLEMRLG